jgi:hypothetical protein
MLFILRLTNPVTEREPSVERKPDGLEQRRLAGTISATEQHNRGRLTRRAARDQIENLSSGVQPEIFDL